MSSHSEPSTQTQVEERLHQLMETIFTAQSVSKAQSASKAREWKTVAESWQAVVTAATETIKVMRNTLANENADKEWTTLIDDVENIPLAIGEIYLFLQWINELQAEARQATDSFFRAKTSQKYKAKENAIQLWRRAEDCISVYLECVEMVVTGAKQLKDSIEAFFFVRSFVDLKLDEAEIKPVEREVFTKPIVTFLFAKLYWVGKEIRTEVEVAKL
jgi:hypothetical protein